MKKKTWILKMRISEIVEDNEDFYLDDSDGRDQGIFIKELAREDIQDCGDVEEIEIISIVEQKI